MSKKLNKIESYFATIMSTAIVSFPLSGLVYVTTGLHYPRLLYLGTFTLVGIIFWFCICHCGHKKKLNKIESFFHDIIGIAIVSFPLSGLVYVTTGLPYGLLYLGTFTLIGIIDWFCINPYMHKKAYTKNKNKNETGRTKMETERIGVRIGVIVRSVGTMRPTKILINNTSGVANYRPALF